MKILKPNINESISRFKSQLNENSLVKKFAKAEPPMRSELFSADQMEHHGKFLAETHTLTSQIIIEPVLLKRLAENEVFLFELQELLIESLKAKHAITPAEEWLLDNFYLIEEQIRTGKKHLPKGYSRELPRLSQGLSKGLPRVYDIAQEIISHGDGRVDPENLNRFVSAYQTVTVLKIGELWAIPIMLRLALIENLRRVAVKVAAGRIERNLADAWADDMIEMFEKDPKNLIQVVADMSRSDPPMTTSFVSELTRKLQGLSHSLSSALTWIEQRLSDSGQNIEELIQLGNQQQAADQVSISNSIGSLRFLETMDWKSFVETMSTVEKILMKDPGGVYGQMDFSTRDQYRHVIEKIAKHSPISEEETARTAIRLSQESIAVNGSDTVTAHVGYYLIDKGLTQLESACRVRVSPLRALAKISGRVPLLIYSGSIILLTILIIAFMLEQVYDKGFDNLQLVLLGILFFIAAANLPVALVNWISTLIVKPGRLPRMDYSEGIPAESRALIVIPSILINENNIRGLTESLEIRFLGNQDSNLYYCLLTDYQDADKESLPEDESLLQLAVKMIEDLNKKYKGDNFFLFHRPRQWNARERKWIGYERKRGKLEELNSLLRGGLKDRFSVIVGKTDVLPYVKYVITLDSDTQLPRDSARQMVGTMAHPLNRPRYNAKRKCVVEGHAILQPRVAVSLPGTNRSRYAGLFGSEPGIDPYTRAISDVYQDLFGEGSFIGKGIYDVDMFEQVLKGSFPENQILSHDLIEGCYTRAGLLSDVQLFEEYPSHYFTDVKRRHRWIRGDWQIIKWLLPFVPSLNSGLRRNALSWLSQWKIGDNLRRSLSPFALTLLLFLGWTVLSDPWFWTLWVIGIILIPPLIISVVDFFNKPADVLLSQHLAAALRSTGTHFSQAVFTIITLPYEMFFSLDAIIRTLWRMIISHKKLLEWNPSHDRRIRVTLPGSFRKMWIAPTIVIAVVLYFVLTGQSLPAAALSVLVLWFISPYAAWWISLPQTRHEVILSNAQKLFLREIARKTWAFFHTFVGPEDHWLPPDNYQENPVGVVAHRTSPTNIGLSLLAGLSAYDFGYITTGELVERISNTFSTMENLERYYGHFYNWYDTRSLTPLTPLYISSVDSGNLMGHLLTLRQGIISLPDKKIVSQQVFEGIGDTLSILISAADGIQDNRLAQFKKELDSSIDSRLSTLEDFSLNLKKLTSLSIEIQKSYSTHSNNEIKHWAGALADQCRAALDELTFLVPRLNAPDPSDPKHFMPGDEIPTLRRNSSD